MKKVCIIFFGAFALCYNVKSQYYKNDFAINLNPTISTFYGNSNLKKFNSNLTFSFGINYSYYLSERFFLHSGFEFDRKGAKVGVDYFDNNGNYYNTSNITFIRDYLVVPIMYSFVSQTKVKFYAGGGLFGAYLINTEDFNSKISYKNTYASQTQQFDFGINFEIGCFVPIQNHFLLDLGIKENLGLSNTLRNELATKNNTLGFQMGLRYKF
jgi:hypothetical protein